MVKADHGAQPDGPNRTVIIARNTVMVGIEVALSTVLGLLVTIPVNRIIGPERLGYFSYIQWLAGSSAIVASLGLPAATRKYMAEYVGSNDTAMARTVFHTTLRLQAMMSLAVVAIGEVLVFTVTDRRFLWSSALLVLCQLPRLLVGIPSQANESGERAQKNAAISVITQVVLALSVLLSLWLGWDLVGIALAQLFYVTLELVLKMRSVHSWLGSGPRVPLPKELRSRMVTFSGYGLVLAILNLVIWDRSDMLFLRRLDSNLSHLTFLSVALNMNDRILNLLRTFTYAAGITVTAEYGRNRDRLSGMTAVAMRYGLLLSAPALAGLAALGGVAVELMYGPAYRPVSAPLLATALFSIFKPLLLPVMAMLQAFERQRLIVVWGCLWAAMNILLDVTLIPSLGPLGAALANGVAQSGMVLALWWSVRREYKVLLPHQSVLRIFTSAAACGLCAAGPRLLPMSLTLQLVSGIATGLAGFLLAARLLRLFLPEDQARLEQLAAHLPASTAKLLRRTLNWLVVPAAA